MPSWFLGQSLVHVLWGFLKGCMTELTQDCFQLRANASRHGVSRAPSSQTRALEGALLFSSGQFPQARGCV